MPSHSELPFPEPDSISGSVRLEKLISGGQTGVDRAALDAAIVLGWPYGGWCPAGRRAEDGSIPKRYELQESPDHRYPQRTEWNVRDSDGTLILYREPMVGGTLLTRKLAKRIGRPCFCVPLNQLQGVSEVLRWLGESRLKVLNVAGPRESTCPGIYDDAKEFLLALLSRAPSTNRQSSYPHNESAG